MTFPRLQAYVASNSMNYTLEHLKIAYNAGAKKFPFDQTLELIGLLGHEGLQGLLAHPEGSAKNANPPATSPVPARRQSKRGASIPGGRARKRGETLSKRILHFLSNKGNMGAHVKDIAESINAPRSSVSVWFYNAGKKYLKSGEIKKVAPASFSYTSAGKAES
jgi:hypothetical protein